MKRSASSNYTSRVSTKGPRHTRVTRSVQRETIAQAQEAETRLKKSEKDAAKARVLMSTPLLRALPFLIRSGFLYKHECRKAAITCNNWKAIVAECHTFIPEESLVEVVVEKEHRYRNGDWPNWVTVRGLQEVIPSQKFCRVVFQKLCDLKVAVETTERKKKKIRQALPKWGTDFLGINIFCWGPNTRNGGGIHITFVKDLNRYQAIVPGWRIRLDSLLRLWTFEGFHKWKNIYNGAPLWRWRLIDYPYSDSDDEDDINMMGVIQIVLVRRAG